MIIHFPNGIRALTKNPTTPKQTLKLPTRRDLSVRVRDRNNGAELQSWLVSCSLHTVLLIFVVLMWRTSTNGTGASKDRTVGIAIDQLADDGGENSFEGGASKAGSSSAAAPRSVPMTTDNDTGPPISIENIVSALVGDQTGSADGVTRTDGSQGSGSQGNGLSGDGGSGNSSGRGPGKGNKSKADFFGIVGSGSSFAYVMDRSDSMNSYEGAPLRYAKRELIQSLTSLNEYNQFQVVFYNDSLSPMSSSMLFATDSNKNRAANFVRNMPGDGGTAHLPALRQALSLSPEVLFFLTDADDPSLTMPQLLDIQRRTEISRTTIHTVQFNLGPAANDGSWIRKLAEMNRGTYKYIDVTSINQPPDK